VNKSLDPTQRHGVSVSVYGTNRTVGDTARHCDHGLFHSRSFQALFASTVSFSFVHSLLYVSTMACARVYETAGTMDHHALKQSPYPVLILTSFDSDLVTRGAECIYSELGLLGSYNWRPHR